MIRKQGQWNPKTRSKWCAECSTWVASNKWPSHNENHVKTITEQLPFQKVNNQMRTGFEKFVKAVPSITETANWPDWQKRYEEVQEQYSKLQSQHKRTRDENQQIRRVLAEMGRAIVTTYDKY